MRMIATVLWFAISLGLTPQLNASTPPLYKSVSRGDLKSLQEAFRSRSKLDGDEAEELDVALGKSIKRNPVNFLTALKANRKRVVNLEPILGAFGESYVDDFVRQKIELKKRLRAIQSVKKKSLRTEKTDCERVLNLQIESLGRRQKE